MKLIDEYTLLGASLMGAQKFEFALYGLVSHLAHAYEGKKGKRFSELTPEKFLRGSVNDLKLTLGQLEIAFGKKLLISNDELKEFIKRRNLIAHNYWRLTRTNIQNGEKMENPESFLKEFIQMCDYWQSVLNGCICFFLQEMAKKENRISEVTISEKQQREIDSYYKHIRKNIEKDA